MIKKNGKTKYRCNHAKRRGQQCDSGRMIYEPDYTSDLFIVQYNGLAHNHDEMACNRSDKISSEMAELINECASKRMTAKKVIEHIDHLRKTFNLFIDEVTPTAQQIYYIIRKVKNVEAPPILSIGELNQWCEDHISIPEDQDEPFVLRYQTNDEDGNMFFRFAISTPRMLSNCVGINQICVDATYKLVWQGFPFIVVGTVDRAKKFHPLAFALTTSETEADFKFIFVAIKSAVEKMFGCEFCPRVLIADGAYPIRNAFEAAFIADVMIMCYAHVVRNVSKQPLNNRQNMNSILIDLRHMNLSSSVQEFQMLSKLFLKKYKKIEPAFVKYFQEQWHRAHTATGTKRRPYMIHRRTTIWKVVKKLFVFMFCINLLIIFVLFQATMA